MNPAYRRYLFSLLEGYPSAGDADVVRRFLDWADDPGRRWQGSGSVPSQPSWDQYGDAMGCYAPGALDEEALREMDVDPSKVSDTAGLLNDWATLIWEHVSDTDIFGDALGEALERQGVLDPDTVSVERETATVSDPADPLALSMGGDGVPGMVR